MKTLILKHNGHEAHVPYELPDSLRFDCFVPDYGTFSAHVDLRGDEVVVIEVTGLPEWFCSHDAVLEQAGDVVRTFLEALPIEWSECEKAEGESSVAFVHRANLIESSWGASTRPSDMSVLSTIAEMALLESDLHTAWCRLPFTIADIKLAPTQVPTEWAAAKCLARFIYETLVPRAQDLATAAAKRRAAQWNEEEEQERLQRIEAERDDFGLRKAREVMT